MTLSPIISLLIEAGIMIYYTNKIFAAKKSVVKSNLCILGAYLILAVLTQLNIPLLNVGGFVIVNTLLIRFCFKNNWKNTAFHSAMLAVMMTIGETAGSLAMNLQTKLLHFTFASVEASMVHAIMSKLLYFIAVVILAHMLKEKGKKAEMGSFLWLSVMPATTFVFLVVITQIISDLNIQIRYSLVFLSFLLTISNLVVYWVYDGIIAKNIEIQALQQAVQKSELDYTSYRLMQEKYDQMRVMQHDFRKHFSVLETLIEGEQTKALSYIREIQDKNAETMIVKCTDNQILNVLLSQKMEIAHQNKIDFRINFRKANINFISDIDIVSIFSNLLDNAIESCQRSVEKKIMLAIYPLNQVYAVIKVENSADVPPDADETGLKTRKKNKTQHGIGMTSIRKALKNYQGDMQWDYNESAKRFQTTVVIRIPNTVK